MTRSSIAVLAVLGALALGAVGALGFARVGTSDRGGGRGLDHTTTQGTVTVIAHDPPQARVRGVSPRTRGLLRRAERERREAQALTVPDLP